MARIVVTGGAGFLGSHLVDAIRARGDAVVVVDNLVTGSLENIAHHDGDDQVEFVERDVCDGIFLTGPVDAVLHLASPASPRDYLELPIQTLKAGGLGTHNALGLARAKGAAFLIASHERGLRGSAGPPAAGELLGAREPRGSARRVRRGEALRRGHHDGLPEGARPEHADRADLQHLRTADAPRRRARAARPSSTRRSAAAPSRCTGPGSRPGRSATARTPWPAS